MDLSAKTVTVAGAGGLGSNVLYHLASAGVGHIRIIDSDVVERPNLNRQFIHFESDIGRRKVQSAAEKLSRYKSSIQISPIAARVDECNASELLDGSSLVVACVDNAQTRYLLNRFCSRAGVPLVDGGVSGLEGYDLLIVPHSTPCYRCIFPEPQLGNVSDMLGAAVGVIGSMMAIQAIKLLAGIPVESYFHYHDLLGMRTTTITTARNPNCPDCGS